MSAKKKKSGSTLRLKARRISTLKLRLPKGIDLQVDFATPRTMRKSGTTPLALRFSDGGGKVLVDLISKKDPAGCRGPVPIPPRNPSCR